MYKITTLRETKYNLRFLKLRGFDFFDRVSFSWISWEVFHGIVLLCYPLQEQQHQFVGMHDQVYRLGIVQEFVEGVEELLKQQQGKMIGRCIHTRNLDRGGKHLLLECWHHTFNIEIHLTQSISTLIAPLQICF